MKKKNTRAEIRKAAQLAEDRSELNRRILYAATHTVNENMQNLDTTLRGLEEEQIALHRYEYGTNKVTKGKKKTLPQRLAGAFINPFTAILFCLALVLLSYARELLLPSSQYEKLRQGTHNAFPAGLAFYKLLFSFGR